jgi:hypothetical protein
MEQSVLRYRIDVLFAMAATSATSLADKMHFCKKTRDASVSALRYRLSNYNGWNKSDILVDKMHFCKIMEQSVLRYRIDVLFDDGCNKCDIYS